MRDEDTVGEEEEGEKKKKKNEPSMRLSMTCRIGRR